MPVKEPNSKREYGFDYSAELGDDAIASSTWAADEGLTLTGGTSDATSTSVWVEGGEEGQTLTATNRVVTAFPRTYERVLTFLIRAAVDPTEDDLLTASGLVRAWAPPPTDQARLPDYNARAARAERMVAAYLRDTGGYKTSANKGVESLRKGENYGGLSDLRSSVASVMGVYYLPPSGTASSSNVATLVDW